MCSPRPLEAGWSWRALASQIPPGQDRPRGAATLKDPILGGGNLLGLPGRAPGPALRGGGPAQASRGSQARGETSPQPDPLPQPQAAPMPLDPRPPQRFLTLTEHPGPRARLSPVPPHLRPAPPPAPRQRLPAGCAPAARGARWGAGPGGWGGALWEMESRGRAESAAAKPPGKRSLVRRPRAGGSPDEVPGRNLFSPRGAGPRPCLGRREDTRRGPAGSAARAARGVGRSLAGAGARPAHAAASPSALLPSRGSAPEYADLAPQPLGFRPR